MGHEVSKGFCAVALMLATASSAMAAAEQISGKVCWTGTTNVIATTKADVAFTFDLDWVFTSDDGDPKKSSTGKCVGVRGIVAGKKESPPHFCIHYSADGATHMTRAVSDMASDTTAATLFGGTGSKKGITGNNKGGKPEEMKAPKGMFAGCRQIDAEHIMPD